MHDNVSSGQADPQQPLGAGLAAKLIDFCGAHAPTPPRKECAGDEVIALCAADGLCLLTEAPASGVKLIDDLPRSEAEAGQGRYLWAINLESVPYALELTAVGQLERIKHTNLTGGGSASCAGELWFLNANQFVFNGKSGRYGVTSAEQLGQLCHLFAGLGYTVAATGFDEDAGWSLPHFTEGDVVWVGAK